MQVAHELFEAIRMVLPAAWLILAALSLVAAMVFLLAAAWFGRKIDIDGGEYRDAGKTSFGRLTESQRVGLLRRYP